MNHFIAVLMTAVTCFVATNLDDLIILSLFFAQTNARFRKRHIILGRYGGFVALILASLPGFLGGLVLPKTWIGLLGFLPLAIGIRQLLQGDLGDHTVQTVTHELQPASPRPWTAHLVSLLAPQTYHVAAVTFANGGDNIGIYVPLFASLDATGLLLTLGIFMILVGVWCYIAYQLVRHPLLAPLVSRYGHAIVPYVLIGLGIFILFESQTYQLFPGFQP